MQWAMSTSGTVQHHLLVADQPGVLRCPCCRRAVVPDADGFRHTEQPDCMCHAVPPWNSHLLRVFGGDTRQRHHFVSNLLWLQARKLAIHCHLCCGTIPLFAPAAALQANTAWRGLRLTIAAHHPSGALATGLLVIDGVTKARATQRYLQAMLDIGTFRLHILPLESDTDVASLLPTTASYCGLPGQTLTCNVCHLVSCVEPLARQRLMTAAFRAEPKSTAADTMPNDRCAPVHNAPTHIRNTMYGDISVVVDMAAWQHLTVEGQNQAIVALCDTTPTAEPPVIGLWCLRCAQCTVLAHQTLSRRRGKTFAPANLRDDLHRFDADCVTYGPKIGISRRRRMVRHLRLRGRSPATDLELMLMECDTTGSHTYSLTKSTSPPPA